VGVTAATRIAERRADRNALYITRDLKAAKKTMDWLHSAEPVKVKTEGGDAPKPQSKKLGIISELIATHPSYHCRMQALEKSFNIVSQYPAPQTAKKVISSPEL
jgi:Zn-dependent protease with chaperone function